jgi:hypothetical protein
MILIACPIKDRGWAVPHWYRGIEENMEAAPIHVAALLTESGDDTEELLKKRDVELFYDDEPGRLPWQIDTHIWDLERYAYMARLRNRLVELALEMDVDYFLSLDSDIILPPGGLEVILDYAVAHPGVVSPKVQMGMTSSAWNTMHWTDPLHPGRANRHRTPEEGRADVVMAAMLLDRSALECRWQGHDSGEDIGFCLNAEARGILRWWLPSVQCRHLMHRM